MLDPDTGYKMRDLGCGKSDRRYLMPDTRYRICDGEDVIPS